ncbi:MAG: site-specific DNA-methyltransferase [Salinivirgaceae bacterium]|nr:site-specific DNA-methyltransferase [Salinivirgaceae bacterium]
MSNIKEELIANLDQRVADEILLPKNAELLKKLIANAETDNEAIMIAQLGTIYKKTGLHFDPRLEKMTDDICYFKKNEALSFHTDDTKPTHKLIIGDNYEAMQNLLIPYKGKIDVIYIDPPYGKDSMGEFARTNYENAITRDNLLSMLYPRLILAKQLLSDSGVIFCSIDDKNQAYVKCLFDEVFGEKNYSGMLVWQKKQKPSYLSQNFVTLFEYILCYTKDSKYTFPFTLEKTTAEKKWPINNSGNPRALITFPAGRVSFNLPDGVYKAQDMSDKNIITYLTNDVIIKDGKNVNEFTLDGEWRYSQKTLDEIFKSDDIIYIAKVPFRPNHIKSGGEIKKMKNFLANAKLSKDGYGCETNENASDLLMKVFGKTLFDNPKPIGLVELLVKATTYDKNDAIILDFFAGSGTTAHAVLELNRSEAKDGNLLEDNVSEGKRTFILCQLNENLDEANQKTSKDSNEVIENQIALCDKYGRPHELSEVTVERIRRIMTGKCYDGNSDFMWAKENVPYGGNLDVYEIGRVSNKEISKGKTPFDVIDETLYDKDKFLTVQEKVEWVCQNFNNAQKTIEQDSEWLKRNSKE